MKAAEAATGLTPRGRDRLRAQALLEAAAGLLRSVVGGTAGLATALMSALLVGSG